MESELRRLEIVGRNTSRMQVTCTLEVRVTFSPSFDVGDCHRNDFQPSSFCDTHQNPFYAHDESADIRGTLARRRGERERE